MNFDSDNRWVYVSVTAVLSVLIYVGLEMVLFEGEWMSAVVQGAFGGVACGLVLFEARRYQ